MKKFYLPIISALLVTALLFTSCITSPRDFIDILDSPAGDAIFDTVEAFSEASKDITPENEYYIGRSVAAAITSQYALYKDAPEMTSYLNAICGAITMNSSVPYLFKGYCVAILDTDEINAMATPGGHIFISRGLINACSSEDELAAVISHEIAHIQLRHSISAIKASRMSDAVGKGVKATAMASVVVANRRLGDETGIIMDDETMESILEATASFSDITNNMAEKLLNSGFSKSQEFNADETALTLMIDAGYDPYAMINMLKAIPTGGKHGWDSTHPAPERRIKNVTSVLEDMEEDGLIPSVSTAARKARAARFEANTL